jgi:hypothetical protein
MTIKDKVKAYRKMAEERAALAAKYAKGKEYGLAARWYTAADNFIRIADELSNHRR